MNKLKNIGISALAGSLVSLSAAQAGGVTVNGSWELTYTNLGHHEVTGNKLGMNKNLSWGASGDLTDGGGVTWAYSVASTDALGLSSASMNINMGGIATLAYDSGTGGYGANAVDNIVPTAWEEIDAGMSTGITDLGRVSGKKGVVNLTVKAPTAGTGFSVSWVNRLGADHVADGATSGNSGDSQGVDVVLDFVDYNAAHFGFRWGVAAEMEILQMSCAKLDRKDALENLASCDGKKHNPYAGSMYTTLKLGPISLGTQATFVNPADGASSGILNKRSIVAGAAFLVGDTLSFSYGEAWDRYRYNDRNRGLGPQVGHNYESESKDNVLGGDENEYETVRFRGISAAINMGPVALKAFKNKAVGKGLYTEPQKQSEINLSIAF